MFKSSVAEVEIEAAMVYARTCLEGKKWIADVEVCTMFSMFFVSTILPIYETFW